MNNPAILNQKSGSAESMDMIGYSEEPNAAVREKMSEMGRLC